MSKSKQFESDDFRWMRRAMELAARGGGLASPNPTTGAVLVRGGRIVSEGFHTFEGCDHAEVLALRKAGAAARGATLYVNLEPCCHTGRTGPCVDAIIAAGVRRVSAAMEDPNPLVAGKGFRKLRAAGIEVATGAGEAEARRMHAGFARWVTSGLPLVTLKSGMTLDGQLALRGESQQAGKRRGSVRSSATWITSEDSRAEVHRMRHASDALLTGIGTVLADDPLMTDRSGLPRRRPLLRVIVDSKLRLPLDSQIVQTANGDVLLFTVLAEDHPRARLLREKGVEVVHLAAKNGHVNLQRVVRELGRRDMLNVILEAGSELNGAALAAGIVDKVVLFIAPKIAGTQDAPLARLNSGSLPALQDVSVARYGPDVCVSGYLRPVYKKDHRPR